MDDKILHNLLFKAAKDAEYTNFEIEQINLESEKMFIRWKERLQKLLKLQK